MRTDETRCTAAIWLLDDIHVDAFHETYSLVSDEHMLSFRPSFDGHENRLKANRLQYNEFHPSSSDQIDQRISSSSTFIRNEGPPNNIAKD
ncbi:unnamed protein product [Protopolystoma xenopodis]|uniref:Uncharacterized protein n=1 Tax=Protopolystoma xenopodis TaxID=117903 RepID=A0A3S5C5F8_9PLAT|nr:unnamed protein product [Protopolystoma xenopodis]